jgi:hypothetical protein
LIRRNTLAKAGVQRRSIFHRISRVLGSVGMFCVREITTRRQIGELFQAIGGRNEIRFFDKIYEVEGDERA